MEDLSKTFKALSDGNRIRIICMLEEHPLCVCEITAILKLATSTVSKHLSILKEAGFIFEQREGKWVNYHLNRATQNQTVKKLLSLFVDLSLDDKVFASDREQVKIVNRGNLCQVGSKRESFRKSTNQNQ